MGTWDLRDGRSRASNETEQSGNRLYEELLHTGTLRDFQKAVRPRDTPGLSYGDPGLRSTTIRFAHCVLAVAVAVAAEPSVALVTAPPVAGGVHTSSASCTHVPKYVPVRLHARSATRGPGAPQRRPPRSVRGAEGR